MRGAGALTHFYPIPNSAPPTDAMELLLPSAIDIAPPFFVVLTLLLLRWSQRAHAFLLKALRPGKPSGGEGGASAAGHALTTVTLREPIRKDGEWQRVNLQELDAPVRKAFLEVHETAQLAPIEEYDTLRALQSYGLHVQRTLEWLERHRIWWEEVQPRDKQRFMIEPGVKVQAATGMARWLGLDRHGIGFFYADLERWAPHLSSVDAHTKFTISGLEMMREAARQFTPGPPVYAAIIDIRCWALWHVTYVRHIVAFVKMFVEHYPRCVDRIYLLNAPKLFAQVRQPRTWLGHRTCTPTPLPLTAS